MRKVKSAIFETNSSSIHEIKISEECNINQEKMLEIYGEYCTCCDKKYEVNSMNNYLEYVDIELNDIQAVRDALEKKSDFIREMYPYAKTELDEIENALYVLWELESDMVDKG